MASDALVVGESFISEHYFNSDGKQSFGSRVLERRKDWEASRTEGHATTRSRFTEARASLLSTFATIGESDATDLTGLYSRLRTILGFDRTGLTVVPSGPVRGIATAGLTGAAPLVIIDAQPAEDSDALIAKDAKTLLVPFEVDEKTEIVSVSRLLSYLFVSDEAPDFALVLAGPIALIAEKTRWAEGRYLAVDLQLVSERADDKRGGEIDRALTCLSAESLAPDAEGSIWWAGTLEDSVKHTVGVSKDLREGVRLSIEIIANEVVNRRSALGLSPLPAEQAQPLAKQSLRFLYRILFLLYAEASPELGVLPAGDPVYERGYSLDRLRDLTLVELTDPRAQSGTHLFESLAALFTLVDKGHDGDASTSEHSTGLRGLTFGALRADLFLPKATALIDEVGLGNSELQRVLQHLLLSKESKKGDRGFISYAELGINQLGAVYEGLMSFTGFFAVEDLYEVAKDGNSEKGSWVIPVTRAQGIASKDFVKTEDPITKERKPVLHERGTFVYRLAGRERQQSASYYTPEVLTRFTVSQALEELLDQNDQITPAREILNLTICEPALGSGAFAIEAVRQLAEQYLRRRQDERGERIDPDEYAQELQKVKAYLALHNVYGVDLNATAVELAEISLWLDTMSKDLAAPWFGLHLKRGNSLIGSRRAVFRRDQVADKTWLKAIPEDRPLAGDRALDGGIHHFLLPAEGWGSAINAKEARALAPEALERLKAWRKQILVKPTKQQVAQLVDVAQRIEVLWGLALRRLTIAEQQIRRSISVWGVDDLPVGGAVTREEIEDSLADSRGAYQRLKTVMDAWNALWFWPLTDELTNQATTTPDGDVQVARIAPPTLEKWIDALRGLVGYRLDESSLSRGRRRWEGGSETLASGAEWADLEVAEASDLAFAGALNPDVVRQNHPWLDVCAKVAEQQGFFHWELDFGSVFAERGGFDLQVGNPPWVRPRSDVEALLAEGDPWWQFKAKSTAAEDLEHRTAALAVPGVRELLINGTADVASLAAFLGDTATYPHLAGLQPDLYRCFMEVTWRHARSSGLAVEVSGCVGLIHPESHFTDEKAGPLRSATYRRLRRHWQFVNELSLFEVHHLVTYGVHTYGPERPVSFLQASSLYHPATVEASFKHLGSGAEPGLKDPDGNWDLRPHAHRIQHIDHNTLATWHGLLENDDVPIGQTRMVYTVNRAAADVLNKLAAAPRLGSLGLKFSAGWHEKNDRTKGRFAPSWGVAGSWDSVILQGPHLHVANPFYKSPNATMLHNQDWTPVDLETLPPDAIPVTSYKPAGDPYEYDVAYTDWGTETDPDPARDQYRIAWRTMAAPTGERTLIPAVIPPGSAHVDGVFAACLSLDAPIVGVQTAGLLGSLLADFLIRAVPKKHIRAPQVGRLPTLGSSLVAEILLRTLRLNCLTQEYGFLWRAVYRDLAARNGSSHPFDTDEWTGGIDYPGRPALADIGPEWTPDTPLRRASDRRQALLEIDALVALSLNITLEELVTIYRTQFPVLYGYDHHSYVYDANGRLVPTSVLQAWRSKGGQITPDERRVRLSGRAEREFALPFTTLDREADWAFAFAALQRQP